MDSLNWETIRKDFPILATSYKGKGLVYLDNAATSQKPQVVLDAICDLYTTQNANIHRGLYRLSEQTTEKYLASKQTVADFIHAPSYKSIIYTRNTTDGMNMLAHMLEPMIHAGDELLIPIMEHHSNLIPWMQLAQRTKAQTIFLPLTKEGEIDTQIFHHLLTKKTKVLALSHISNVLGTINPIQQMIAEAKKVGAYTVIDGAQAVGHIEVDAANLGCDFYVFSGHKMLAPVGIGVVYGKEELLEQMSPWYWGGGMVALVTTTDAKADSLPWKFEPGTSNYEGAIALARAVAYLTQVGLQNIEARTLSLRKMLEKGLRKIPGITIYGTSRQKSCITSFVLDGVHAHDIAALLDQDNICIRAGNHCAQPLLDVLGCAALARVSLHFYNNEEDIDRFLHSLNRIRTLFPHG